MRPIQENTKFINHLQPEWRKFVTDVKLPKDLKNTNFDHLYAYLRQHKAHTDEAPVANHPSLFHHQSYQAHEVNQPSHASFPLMDSRLFVSLFLPIDDPIVSLNKAMAFISTTFTSRYLPTNNQLQTSSNLRNQATIQDVRQRLYAATTVKKKATWQDNVQNLKGIGIQHDNGDTVTISQSSHEILTPVAFQNDDLDAFDSDCNEAPSASAILMAKLSSYDLDVIS
nr:integrase, catalytic region, zinc finger, CCHC-type, peptidase aspartic, catalytic [Tanacetum cinerariifolium]